VTTLDELRSNLKKQSRPDPAVAAAQPVAEQPAPEPVVESKPARLSVARLEAMRATQKLFGDEELSKRYPPHQVSEFLSSRWSLHWQPAEQSEPLTVEEIAATNRHRGCSDDCPSCGQLIRAGFRHVYDDEHPTGAWLKIAEPKVEPVKVELPLHPPAEMLPECIACDHYTCQDKRRALMDAGYYYDRFAEPPCWRRMGQG